MVVPVEWVDEEEWAAIVTAFAAVEGRAEGECGVSKVAEVEEQVPDAKRVRRQLPASWLAPPVRQSQYGIKQNLVFRGRIIYSQTADEAESAADELVRDAEALGHKSAGKIAVGFDMEWRPSFQRGAVPGRTAVLQLCLDSARCYVFHIFHSGIPPQLQKFLEEEMVSKAGIGISGDVSKLKLDFGVRVADAVDLSAVANRKLRTSQNWSLCSLAKELTCKALDKSTNVRCSDWEIQPLSSAQLRYAATDAFGSLHLYQLLASFPDPQN